MIKFEFRGTDSIADNEMVWFDNNYGASILRKKDGLFEVAVIVRCKEKDSYFNANWKIAEKNGKCIIYEHLNTYGVTKVLNEIYDFDYLRDGSDASLSDAINGVTKFMDKITKEK